MTDEWHIRHDDEIWMEADGVGKWIANCGSAKVAAQIVHAHNSRRAPVVTDTGLETVKPLWGTEQAQISLPNDEYVTRSQAVELLAAERAEKEAFAEEIKEAAYEAWPEASDVGSDAPDIIRQLGKERKECLAEVEELRNKLYRAEVDNAAKEAERAEQWRLRREMEADRDTQKAIAASLEADNAAQAARIEELDAAWLSAEKQCQSQGEQLAAAEKALSVFLSEYDELYLFCDEPETMVSAVEAARAVLGGKPAAHELVEPDAHADRPRVKGVIPTKFGESICFSGIDGARLILVSVRGNSGLVPIKYLLPHQLYVHEVQKLSQNGNEVLVCDVPVYSMQINVTAALAAATASGAAE